MPDDKILSRGLNHLFGHCRQDVDFENPLDLIQEPIQQPEVGRRCRSWHAPSLDFGATGADI